MEEPKKTGWCSKAESENARFNGLYWILKIKKHNLRSRKMEQKWQNLKVNIFHLF
jgi:hypothetical protein